MQTLRELNFDSKDFTLNVKKLKKSDYPVQYIYTVKYIIDLYK